MQYNRPNEKKEEKTIDKKTIKMEEDDDEDIPLASLKLKNTQRNVNCIPKKEDITTQLNVVLEPNQLRESVETMHHEVDNEAKCQAMETVVQMVVEDEIETEIIPALLTCLTSILSPLVNSEIFPADSRNEESMADSISTPLFVMFRNHFQLSKEEDNRRKLLARMLAELQMTLPRVGYLFLYFLKVWGREEEKREGETSRSMNEVKASVYKDFCSQRDKKLEQCLLADLKLCQDDNVYMLCYLVPDVFTEFPNIAVNNSQLLHLVVSTVDSSQLQDLVCVIMQGRLKMLKKESFSSLVTTTLNWDTFEQYCFWQLVVAHSFPIEYMLPILPKLNFRNHAEPLTSILFMIKQEKPSPELLRQLLLRQASSGDLFVVAVLRFWCREYEDKLGELLANLLSSRYTAPSPMKRNNRKVTKNNQSGMPSGELVLSHLDQLRQHCVSDAELRIYNTDVMQRALQQAQAASSDTLRKNYGDLFALAEVNEENDVPPPRDSSRKHASSNVKGPRKAAVSSKERFSKRVREKNSESSEQSSEEEEIVKPKQAKKRKKINPVGSDSD